MAQFHSYEFEIGDRIFGDPEPDGLIGVPGLVDDRAVKLSSVLAKVGAKAIYTYDFGDNWQHEITIRRISARIGSESCAVCLDGDRQCPPEDCGGTEEFSYFWRTMTDRYHSQPRKFRRWFGGDFDPMAFSLTDVNSKLTRMPR